MTFEAERENENMETTARADTFAALTGEISSADAGCYLRAGDILGLSLTSKQVQHKSPDGKSYFLFKIGSTSGSLTPDQRANLESKVNELVQEETEKANAEAKQKIY